MDQTIPQSDSLRPWLDAARAAFDCLASVRAHRSGVSMRRREPVQALDGGRTVLRHRGVGPRTEVSGDWSALPTLTAILEPLLHERLLSRLARAREAGALAERGIDDGAAERFVLAHGRDAVDAGRGRAPAAKSSGPGAVLTLAIVAEPHWVPECALWHPRRGPYQAPRAGGRPSPEYAGALRELAGELQAGDYEAVFAFCTVQSRATFRR